jgi:dihydroorotase
MSELVIAGGRVIDVDGERTADVVVGADGRIEAVGEGLTAPRRLDAAGCVVAPGLVDLHAHLRQPGREEAETVESGSRAAALGGFTALVAMGDTDPPIDGAAVVREVQHLARGALCEVVVAGTVTAGRRGERLAPLAEMADLGVRIFSDCGPGIQDDAVMRRALEYAGDLGVTVAQRGEHATLAGGGHLHEGAWSTRLGLAGIPALAEESMVARDLALARLTGTRLHLQCLSTAGAVELVRAARADGVGVTAEVTPHHLRFTDADCAEFDTAYKCAPPLRTDDDVAALRTGLADRTIDAVATDHAPHLPEDKERTFDEAPCGMLGLETALAVSLAASGLSVAEVLRALSWAPAAIAGLEDQGGPVSVGRPANLVVFDPAAAWTVEADRLASRSHNTPLAGCTLTGKVRHTLWRGEPVVLDGEAQR